MSVAYKTLCKYYCHKITTDVYIEEKTVGLTSAVAGSGLTNYLLNAGWIIAG